MICMKEEELKITLSGPGIQYSSGISKELAAYIIGVCMRGDENANLNPLATPHKIPQPISSLPKESIAEYVHSKGPKRNPDKILAIAGYLVKNGSENFSPDDIKPLFPKIGEVIPANFGRDFRWAVANTWLAESNEGQNLFYVTNTGRSVIDSNFAPEVISKTKQKLRLRLSKKREDKDSVQI